MEIAQSTFKDIFSDLLAAGTIKMVNGVRKIYPELCWRDKQDLEAEINKLFGNPFPKQLLAIEQLLTASFTEDQRQQRNDAVKLRLQNDYGTIEENVRTVKRKYEKFTQDPQPFTLSEFKESCDLDVEMNKLYSWITTKTIYREKLTEQLINVFAGVDLAEYKQWHQAILLTFATGCFLRTALLFHTVFPDRKFLPNSDNNSQPNPNTELPLFVKTELKEMQERSREVIEVMEQNYHSIKASFVLKKCGDDQHKHCGGDNDDKCSELGAKVYQHLRIGETLDNESLAGLIAKELRNDYQHFQWSVVVLDDYRNAELQLNHEHHANIWLQRFGSKRTGLLQKLARESFIMSKGLGSYGYFLCYRHERAALVFWADTDAVNDVDVVKAYSQLEKNWKDDSTFRALLNEKKAGSVYRVTGCVREMAMNYVFGVGVHVKPSQQPIGMDLAKMMNRTFPLQLGDRSCCVLIWPESTLTMAPLKCQLSDVVEQTLSGAGCYYNVYKGTLEYGAKSDSVAVKEVLLTRSDENKRKLEIANLDLNLGYLKKFDHPNLVQYFGFQAHMPENLNLHFPKYRIVMEYCSGGSLAEVVRNPVTLSQVFNWAHGILEGLAYLHNHNIAHKVLNSDHVLFQGPRLGCGTVKIISIGRIGEVIAQASRSYVPNMKGTSHLYQPGTGIDGNYTGSKTDMWSFGCLLLLMITGDAPVLEKVAVVDEMKRELSLPCIPKDLPLGLDKIIEECLSVKYNQRPSAEVLLAKRFFNSDEHKTFNWVCPARTTSAAQK